MESPLQHQPLLPSSDPQLQAPPCPESEDDEDPSSENEDGESDSEDLDFLDEEEESSEIEAVEERFEQNFQKFRTLLDQRIQDIEDYWDTRVIVSSIKPIVKNVQVGTQTEDENQHLQGVGTATLPTIKVGVGVKGQVKVEVETQTDDTSISAFLSASRECGDLARKEIAKLREAREPLNAERKRIKVARKANGSQRLEDDKQLMELEEAIEAIDLAIDFKNEIVCGQATGLFDRLVPGQGQAELVSRLSSLSVFDLQRLFCKFFTKVVELRCCTKKLEKNADRMEDEMDRMHRRIAIDSQALKDKDKEHENRIMHLISQCALNASGDIFKDMLADLNKTRRKLLDFQRALTELLVRHGYLINGSDYDVKQVVKMLGLDPDDLYQIQTPALPRYLSSHHTNSQPQRRMNQRRNAEILSPEHAASFQMPSTSRKAYQDYPQNLESRAHHGQGSSSSRQSSSHHQSSSRHASSHGHGYLPFEGYRDKDTVRATRDRRDKHKDRNHRPTTYQHQRQEEESHQHGTEVKRVKNKLIIQPNN